MLLSRIGNSFLIKGNTEVILQVTFERSLSLDTCLSDAVDPYITGRKDLEVVIPIVSGKCNITVLGIFNA